MIFRNHSNMMICCPRNISYYHQYWKQLWRLILFVETMIDWYFFNKKFKVKINSISEFIFIWNINIHPIPAIFSHTGITHIIIRTAMIISYLALCLYVWYNLNRGNASGKPSSSSSVSAHFIGFIKIAAVSALSCSVKAYFWSNLI